MAWKVTYRDTAGQQQSRIFDAVSRDELFQQLKGDGISAIRIEEVAANSRAPSSVKMASGGLKWIVAALGVGAVTCACLWWIYRGGGTDKGSPKTGRASNSTSSPKHNWQKPVVPTAKANDSSPSMGEEKTAGTRPPPPPEKDWQTLQREAMARKLGRKKEHEIAYNDSNLTDGNGRKPIHRNSTEHIMSMIFATDLGDMPLPLPTVPEHDKQRMAQILLDKYEIAEDDPDAEEKKAINDVKDALSAHIRNGGDVDEFFSSYHRQLELAHRERTDARNMVLEAAKSGDAELATELLDKYNQNLENKGIKPINLPQWVIEKKARKQ